MHPFAVTQFTFNFRCIFPTLYFLFLFHIFPTFLFPPFRVFSANVIAVALPPPVSLFYNIPYLYTRQIEQIVFKLGVKSRVPVGAVGTF
jgi:hypothetical protein